MKITRPTAEEFKRTATTISAMKFYPTGDAGVRLEVLDLLAAMVGTPADLEWFRRTLRDRVPEWPGLAELRAIYCTSRKPFDGQEGSGFSRIPGFTPGDIERENLEAPKQLTAIAAGAQLREIAGISAQELAPIEEKGVEPKRALPDPEAETRRVRIADEFDKLKANRVIGAISGGGN